MTLWLGVLAKSHFVLKSYTVTIFSNKHPQHLWAVLTENVHWACRNIWLLYACMLCFYVCFAFMFAHMLSSNTKLAHCQNIWKQNSISNVWKWHNLSYRYVSYVKLEVFNIWRTGAWFLKPFAERVKKNHIYDPVKPEFYSEN